MFVGANVEIAFPKLTDESKLRRKSLHKRGVPEEAESQFLISFIDVQCFLPPW